MAFDSFRDFVNALDAAGELKRFSQPVATELEITEIADREMKLPGGQTIHCTARVMAVDGSKISFQIEARDQHEVIVRGLHKRAVIRTESFTKRVKAPALKRGCYPRRGRKVFR